jgi:hypothetical protein
MSNSPTATARLENLAAANELDELADRIAKALVPAIRQGLGDVLAGDGRPTDRLLDPDDCLTLKQAAAIAEVDGSTIGRWLTKTADLSVTVAGVRCISRKKLERHLETMRA